MELKGVIRGSTEEVPGRVAGACGAPVPGVRPQAGDPATGRAVERPPRGPANWIRQDEADSGQRADRPTTDMVEETVGSSGRTPSSSGSTRCCGRPARISPRRSPRPGGRHELHRRPHVLGRSRTAGPGYPGVDLLRLAGPPGRIEPPGPGGRAVAGDDRQDPHRARVRRDVWVPAGVAGAAPAGRVRGPQARRADHASAWPAGRVPAPGLERWLHQTESSSHRRTGSGRPGFHRDGAEPAVGSRPGRSTRPVSSAA